MASEATLSLRRQQVKSVENILANDQWRPPMAGQLLPGMLRCWAKQRRVHGMGDKDTGTRTLELAAEYMERKSKPSEYCCRVCMARGARGCLVSPCCAS